MPNLSTRELARQAFGSPGGKSKILKKILPTIPKHTTYIEPFAGGAAVFWNKDKVRLNVLNDLDPEIAHAYKFIRDITLLQIKKLKQLDWTDSKERFLYMRDKFNPKNDIQKFYKFLYTIKASYGLTRKTFGFKNITNKYICGYLDRLPKLADKLKDVKIFNTDYKNVVKKFDSPNSFFFVDPPYPEEWGFKTMAFGEKQYQTMHDLLKSLEGKFCLTTNIRPWITKMFKDFNMRKVLVPRSFAHGDKPDYEWFIYNYDYNDKKILQETGSGDIAGAPMGDKYGLQPVGIDGKKKKKKFLTEVDLKERYIRISQTSPEKYIRFRIINIDASKGIRAVIGVRKDNKSEVQSYLFVKEKWTESRARTWIQKHKEKRKLEDIPKDMVDVPSEGVIDKSVTNIRDLANYRKIELIDRGIEQGKYWLAFSNDEYFIVDEGVVVWRSSDTFPKLAKKEWDKRTKDMEGKRKKYSKLEEEIKKELYVKKEGDKWCVTHSDGRIIKCFPTKEQADAMHKAIIISKIKKEKMQQIALIVKVIKQIPKERGLFNYLIGIPASKKYLNLNYISNGLLVLAHTFNTKLKLNPEDKIKVLVEEIWRHERKGGVNYSIYKPRVISKSTEKLSTVDKLESEVEARGVAITHKMIQNQGEWFEVLVSNILAEEGKGEEGKEIDVENFPDRMQTGFNKVKESGEWYPFVAQWHLMGKESIHTDFRFKIDEHLEGITLFTPPSINKPDLLTENPKNIRGTIKATQPLGWLEIQGRMERGASSSTKGFPSYFAIVIKGEYQIVEVTDHKIVFRLKTQKGKVRKMIPGKGEEKYVMRFNRKLPDNLKQLNGMFSFHVAHIGERYIMLFDKLKEEKKLHKPEENISKKEFIYYDIDKLMEDL